MAKLDDFDEKTKQAIIEAFAKQGISESEIRDKGFSLESKGKEFSFSYAGVTVTIPAPSQGTLDKLWEKYGGQILTTVLTLAAVLVGANISGGGGQNKS